MLMQGASGGALSMLLFCAPAHAQVAAMNAALGNVITTPATTAAQASGAVTTLINPTMAQIIARHTQYQQMLQNQQAIIASANAAARAAAQAAQQTIPNGLIDGGLKAAVTVATTNAQDSSGLRVWQGAALPVQSTANNGAVNVTVAQTDSRALLSWDTFNVGRDTTLTFNQQGHSDWVVVNRVVGGIDPATGLINPNAAPSPSQILGNIKADGTVYILNRSGVLFGATSQVNLHSLVASSLELGQTLVANTDTSVGAPRFLTRSVKQLNETYLQNGILPAAHSGLLGYITGESHGDVTVARGAQINSSGGFVIIAAPKVTMAGEINPTTSATGTALTPVPGSQVSLVAGTTVDVIAATGATGSVDENVRGLIVTSAGGGTVDVSGSVNAPQGYISLVTDTKGTINLSGILSSSTSVSRNGKVALIGGTVNLLTRPILDFAGNVVTDGSGNAVTQSATISIGADLSGATIPQSSDSLAAFKRSQIDIGNFYLERSVAGYGQLQSVNFKSDDGFVLGTLTPDLFPSLVSIGSNSLISAPSAEVNIGRTANGPSYSTRVLNGGIGQTGVTVGDKAVIDVSGLDSIQVAATRNQLTIDPAKKNELRDTPNYRDTTTDGSFTLNGQTLYLDARISGVRSDGVTWVGSPLLEAGSLAAQTGITAPELMTKGGNVTMATLQLDQPLANGAVTPSISLARTATIDFSGGWVNYDSGFLRVSRLVTADGRTVSISSANPNDRFVAVAGGFVENTPTASQVYNTPLTIDSVFSPAYAEGHDAGSLTLAAPTMTLDSVLHGDATAGSRQITDAKIASATSTIKGDPRKVQAAATQLPSAGLLRVDAVNMLRTDPSTGLPVPGQNNLGASILYGGSPTTTPNGLIHIADSTVNAANLSAVSLRSSGAVIFARDSTLNLQPGGALTVDAGRTISFNGSISVPAGTIKATTHAIQFGDLFDTTDDVQTGDRLPASYIQSDGLTDNAPGWQKLLVEMGASKATDAVPGWFDIVVNSGATLSARGRWTNDQLVTDPLLMQGAAFTSGGSISLTVAPHVAVISTDETGRLIANDISGSIRLRDTSLLDVSGGGYVSASGGLTLNGKGGNVSLINETVYFQLAPANTPVDPRTGLALLPGSPAGSDLFDASASGFQLGSVVVGKKEDGSNILNYFLSALTPDKRTSTVDIASGASIRSFGFKGGGTFKLVTPELAFNDKTGKADGTRIGLNFLDTTGFGTLDLSAWKTAITANVFANGATGNTALAATTMLTLARGDRLNLTQTVLPSILTTDQATLLRSQESGTDISLLAEVKPTNTLGDYDNLAANLVLGGLTELDILDGASITGAAGASISTPKLYNAGTIAIHGGSITQSEILPDAYVRGNITGQAAVGVGQQTGDTPVSITNALSEVFGEANSQGLFNQTGSITGTAATRFGSRRIDSFLTDFSNDHEVYLLGRLGQDQGIVFAAGSTTDLSGTFLQNPRASVKLDGTPLAQGRLIAGGTISALGRSIGKNDLLKSPFSALGNSPYQRSTAGALETTGQRAARRIDAEAGAIIDISGAAATIDLQLTGQTLTPTVVGSNAGVLSAMGGGSVASATIRARAGTATAQAGTLEWFNPVLQQNAASVEGAPQGGNIVSADQIAAAGFDSFVTHGAVTTNGDVSLTLGRSFLLTSPSSLGGGDNNSYSYYASSLNGTGNLSITAPHILLSSIRQQLSNGPAGDGKSSLTLRAQALSGNGASFDVAGAVLFGGGFGSVTLSTQGDLRLIGVAPTANSLDPSANLQTPSLSGGLLAAGALTLQARQVYATTGTGNLVQDSTVLKSDNTVSTAPFIIESLAQSKLVDGSFTPTVTFRREPGTTAATPYSAGSYILVAGESILQDGVLQAPLGRIDLGVRSGFQPAGLSQSVATKALRFTSGSVTSVSASGLSIPYGVTTDQTDYYFQPTLTSALKSAPAAQLELSADSVTTDSGATVNVSGGGSIYAYEFVSGTGGSRDVLSRFNGDAFSSRNGFQYADGRQVYAILPIDSPQLAALYDPIYSSDYANLYGTEVGKAVTLDAVPASGTSPGLAAGTYMLLPAKYALLPGAMRLVENVGSPAPVLGSPTRQLDGSIIVGGTYGVAGTGIADVKRTSFTVQSKDSFSRFSQITTTDGTSYFRGKALADGTVLPRLPNDAARIVIDPGSGLAINSTFLSAPTTDNDGNKGRGSQVDIVGDVINIVSDMANAGPNGVSIVAGTLGNLNAESLLIGGRRTDNSDGTTTVNVSASEIHVRNYATDATLASTPITLAAPEIILAVEGTASKLDLSDQVVLTATGTLVDTRSGVYDVTDRNPDDKTQHIATVGAFLRLANGAERLVDRTGNTASANSRDRSVFDVGAATLTGQSLTLDTSRILQMDAANLAVQNAAIGSDTISFSNRSNVPGFYISGALEAKLSTVNRLTLYSINPIGFSPALAADKTATVHSFRDLVLDAPGVRLIRPTTGKSDAPVTVAITANNVTLRNSLADGGLCTASGLTACNATANSLSIDAAGTLTLGTGVFRTYGFDKSLTLSAAAGTYYNGKGSLQLDKASLSLTTPFIADLGTGAVPKQGAVQADYQIDTKGSVAISAPEGATATAQIATLAPGARFAIHALSEASAATAPSLSITDTVIRATAGTIDLQARGNVTVSGKAALNAPGYRQTFGPADSDQVTVSASGGAVGIVSETGNIAFASGARGAPSISIGAVSGGSGSLSLLAAQGGIDLGDGTGSASGDTLAALLKAASPVGGASLAYDSGKGGFALDSFTARLGSTFTGDIAIRSGTGDLSLNSGQTLKAKSVSLTADGGSTLISGTINTSGINGGAISLFGRDRVSLETGALLDVHSTGYALTDTRRAQAGDVTLGVGPTGAISVVEGATIALGVNAARAGNADGYRAVGKQQTDPVTRTQVTSYTIVEGDKGGTLTLRAPVVSKGGADSVNVSFAGALTGTPSDVSVVGYRQVDLDTGVDKSVFSGVTIADGTATLDAGATVGGKTNFLSGEVAGTIPYFIQHFDISAAYAGLGGLANVNSFRARPGVELGYSGTITLASGWNLGAGRISDYQGALAAGDLKVSPLTTVATLANGKPTTVYEVVAGREADLFQNYVHMLYRTGTGINTGGEAGVFTFRAGRDLNITHSISDGFFSFADQTDGTYLNYQLGGGTLLFQPTLKFTCGADGCGSLAPLPEATGKNSVIAVPPVRNTLNINLNAVDRTLVQVNAPYSDSANSAAAFSKGSNGGGDPLGGAQLLPLLNVTDANGNIATRAAASSDIQLVGGAGALASADPLHIDRGAGGSVTISGSTSYDIATSGRGQGLYFGSTLLQSGNYESLSTPLAQLANLKTLFSDFLKKNGEFPGSVSDLGDVTTRLTFGANSAYDKAILAFADAHVGKVAILGTRKNPTGLATTLDLAVQFLVSTNAIDAIGQSKLGQTIASIGGRVQDAGTVRVPTVVRTGTGKIDIAAALDIDMRDGATPTLRTANNGKIGSLAHPLYQLGGSAVYTAGHLVLPKPTTVDGMVIDPTAYLPERKTFDTLWQPDLNGRLQANAAFATGGGDVSMVAGRDILARRDVWSENVNTGDSGAPVTVATVPRAFTSTAMYGAGDQRWRVGAIGGDQSDLLGSTNIRINAQGFTSGVATLGGGDVRIRAGGDVRELTTALDTTLASADVGASFGSMIFGGGNLDVYVGGNVAGGRFDISTGTASFHAGEDIGSSGFLAQITDYGQASATIKRVEALANLPEIRLTDTVVTMQTGGSVSLASVSALGVSNNDLNSLGYYTGTSGIDILANGSVSIAGGPSVDGGLLPDGGTNKAVAKVLPASMRLTSFNGNIDLGTLNSLLYPSATGQLSLLAGGTLADGSAIAMDDGDPSLLPGLYSAYATTTDPTHVIQFGRGFYLPFVLPNTSDAARRLYHYEGFVQTRDSTPIRIAVGGDLDNVTLYVPKQARISAAGDISNMIFVGQNLTADQSTRIVAGRDITSTTEISTSSDPQFVTKGRIVSQGSYFALGGPGAFFLEAGRNLGPFLNSATIANFTISNNAPKKISGTLDLAGGVLAVGNDFNPWLAPKSADIYAFFGVGKGLNFDALRSTYLDPANVAALPDYLFAQVTDQFGNKSADRSRPIYAPILIDWMQRNEAELLTSLYGTPDVTFQQAYDAFAGKAGLTAGLPQLVQNRFLLDKVYFNELAAPAQVDGPSFQKYVRGYRAVDALFPSSAGYTANDVTGASNGAAKDSSGNPVLSRTGNLDLRLAAIETTRDSNITLLGPGGSAILGSVARTDTLAASRAYQPRIFGSNIFAARPDATEVAFPVLSIPAGYEGILTLRGGAIRSFTDGDLRLNQSRLFTQDSGNVVLWSSNGDLNAGQGPKSAANVPPIVLRFNPNGASEVDSAAGVVGAGIAGFAGIRRLERDGAVVTDTVNDVDAADALAQLEALPFGTVVVINGKRYRFALTDPLNDRTVAQSFAALNTLAKNTTLVLEGKSYRRDTPSIFLLAPAGTVDAGDAGVRAAGDIVVAAARVANADNFKVGGSAVGVPSLSAAPAVALPSGATSAIAANVFKSNPSNAADQRSRISVDVMGFYSFGGGQDCTDGNGNPCKTQ